MPADHPARDMQDTFLSTKPMSYAHTSPIQIHSLESGAPPSENHWSGKCFRCDSDISHLPQFHQIEGMYVDHKVSNERSERQHWFFVREFWFWT